jgi:plasmid stability protein
MAQLIVRDIEEKVVRKLKQRAGEHGVSMEEEHRRILRDTLLPQKKPKLSFKEHLLAMPDVGGDEIFERPKDYGRDVEL